MAIEKEIRDLWKQFSRNPSDKLRNQLLEHYLPLVRKTAQRVHAKLPREVELDDLMSAGTFGLMDAIAAFDLSRNIKFETYCATRIRGAILDELRSWDWVPRLARVRSQRLSAASRQLQVELGREPTEDELASRLQVSIGELDKITRDGAITRIMPLSRPRFESSENDAETDFLEDKTENPFRLERSDLKSLLTRDLTRAEHLVVVLYYFEQMTMKEIGATLDLSESRVSQMHSTILSRLQSQFADRRPELHRAAAA